MNCATHNEVAAVAFCRTCGKPLCNQCTRDVRGVIYCESCLAARMEGTQPAAPYTPPQTPYQQIMDQGLGLKVPPGPASGPNPTVAGILGAIPFGVGAIYCGQYVKGLVHLGIFVLAIIAQSSDVPWYAHLTLGLFLAFFWVYQIMDSVRTARAIQAGDPVPDPFGLADMFGASLGNGPASSRAGGPVPRGEPTKVPVAAAVLIGLGVLFLVSSTLDIQFHRFWALILVVLGVYLFAKHWGLLGTYQPVCVCDRCRTRKLMGPAVLVTLGVQFLLADNADISFWKTWPAILLVIGVVKLVQSNASSTGHIGPLPPGPMGFPPTPPPPVGFSNPTQSTPSSGTQSTDPSASGEVKNV